MTNRIALVAFSASIAAVSVAGAPQDAVTFVERRVVQARSESGLLHNMIVTRPQGASERLPAILFVPWLNCDSLAIPESGLHGAQIILRYLIEQSGMVVGRIEKPGVGGSDGDCTRVDFETELAGFRAGFDRLSADEWVAPGGLIVAAQSYSGGVLPLVARGHPVRGYLVMSSWVRTWLERLLEFERRRMSASNVPLDELAERMRRYSELYGQYLNGHGSPAELIAVQPRLAAVWDGTETHQYGRILRFFQQLQSLNLEAEWAKVQVPTLAMWGDEDLAMHRVDHERIVELVSRNRPGAGQLFIVKGGDHSLMAHGGVADDVIRAIAAWLKHVVT